MKTTLRLVLSLPDEKLKDQHAAERPSAGTLRKSDPFVWNQKTPGEFSVHSWTVLKKVN